MGLQIITYCPLIEEKQSVKGWSKQTVDYIIKNKNEVYKIIRGVSRRIANRPLQNSDIDDIYSEIVIYLYNSDDYNIEKAITRSSCDSVVSLQGYINSCIKFCVLRYMSDAYKDERTKVRDGWIKDDIELSIFDMLNDKQSDLQFDEIIFDLEQHCLMYEYIRYKYGHDIFLIFYVRLLTLLDSSNKDVYKDILNILGVNKKELIEIERKAKRDDALVGIAKAIVSTTLDEAINILERFVYSAQSIKDFVLGYNGYN